MAPNSLENIIDNFVFNNCDTIIDSYLEFINVSNVESFQPINLTVFFKNLQNFNHINFECKNILLGNYSCLQYIFEILSFCLKENEILKQSKSLKFTIKFIESGFLREHVFYLNKDWEI